MSTHMAKNLHTKQVRDVVDQCDTRELTKNERPKPFICSEGNCMIQDAVSAYRSDHVWLLSCSVYMLNVAILTLECCSRTLARPFEARINLFWSLQ